MSSPAARTLLPIVIGVSAAAAFLALDLPPWLRLLTKPVPVLCLAAAVASAGADAFARRLALGLVLSALGDVLLEAGRFVPGLAAFLAAHVAYAAGFYADTPRPAWARAVPFAAWGVATYAVLWPGLGPLAVPVALYAAAFSVMMWRAAARVGARGRPTFGEWSGLAGALLFAASDTLIGLDRFRGPLPGVRLPILLLYWSGQLGLALSALERRPAPEPAVS